jgi:hypothetical protein
VRQWLAKYGSLSAADLSARKAELGLYLTGLANPVYDEYYGKGEYDVVGVGNFKLGKKTWDERYMLQLRCPSKDAPDQRVLKVTIRESDYPELYALHREFSWLREREDRVSRLALQTPPPTEEIK